MDFPGIENVDKDDPIAFCTFITNPDLIEHVMSNCDREIIAELDDLFKNTNKYSAEELMQQDLSGKSIMKRTSYKFTNQDIIAVECYDWDESMQKSDPPNPDILSISINTKELFSKKCVSLFIFIS